MSARREHVFAHWPNRITALRFLGALALFVLLAAFETGALSPEPGLAAQAALFLFIGVAATDWLDGYLARRFGHVTHFGRIADPFVDKILVLGVLVFLAALPSGRSFVPAWVVVLVLARELLVTGLRGFVEAQGLAFPADRWGKLKLVVQCVAIGIVLGLPAFAWGPTPRLWLSNLAHVSVWATLLASLGSGIGYVIKTARLLSGEGR
jgi:CDP-diacylglycerol--glycerol-3-phosphate 3-phosphatidyltransferase